MYYYTTRGFCKAAHLRIIPSYNIQVIAELKAFRAMRRLVPWKKLCEGEDQIERANCQAGNRADVTCCLVFITSNGVVTKVANTALLAPATASTVARGSLFPFWDTLLKTARDWS